VAAFCPLMTCCLTKAVVASATVDVSVPLAGALVGTVARSGGVPATDELITLFLPWAEGELHMVSVSAPEPETV